VVKVEEGIIPARVMMLEDSLIFSKVVILSSVSRAGSVGSNGFL